MEYHINSLDTGNSFTTSCTKKSMWVCDESIMQLCYLRDINRAKIPEM